MNKMKCKNCQKYKKKYNDLKKKIIELETWKGKDKIEISIEDDEYWKVIEHHKESKAGKVKFSNHYIKESDLNIIREFLEGQTEIVTAREIWEKLIKRHKLDISVNEFSGGVNRSKYYYPLYYLPVKILDYLGEVEFSRGGIQKINME